MTFGIIYMFVLLVFWRPQEWLLPWLFGLPLMDVIVAVSLVAFYLELDQNRLQFPRDKPQPYLFIGLWFAALMSHVAHTYFAGMVETIVPVFKICFFGFLLFCVLDRPSRLRSIARLFTMIGCTMALHAMLQQWRGYGFVGSPPMWAPTGHGDMQTRSVYFGIFNDPNDLAQILVTFVPYAFLIGKRRSFVGFLVSCAVVTWLVMAILATHSRGGIIALTVVGAVMFVMILPARWSPFLLLVLSGVALLMCPLSVGFLDESAHERIIYWGYANRMFKENMLFGLGYGMFWQVVDSRAAHNAFVSCYTTIGLFGYWFWFSLIQIGIVGAWRSVVALRNAKTEEQVWTSRFAKASIASMAGFCAGAYFLSRAFVFPMFLLFAVLGAVPVVAERVLGEDAPRLVKPMLDVIVWCTVGTLVSVTYIYISILLLNKAWGG